MSLWELLILAAGLSMDAFAVSICKGLSMDRAPLWKAAVVGLYFGLFQAGMPLIGYFLGSRFSQYISRFDHWIAFILLLLIGISMIRESRGEGEKVDASLAFSRMVVLAVATSIDALAVGVTLAFLKVSLWASIACIGLITFGLSTFGVKLGHAVGAKYRSRAELAGGVILILMGSKILIEHLFF